LSDVKSRLLVGTAGWSISSRYASAFPSGGSHLERYARRLLAVEINSSFYRPHQRKTYARWAASTPSGFRFSVKVPKAMTHERRLADCDDLLDRFIAEVSGLGDKLDVLLVQLPPSLGFVEADAACFFAALRSRSSAAVVVEPRHQSWFASSIDEWLIHRGISRAAADPSRFSEGGQPGGATDTVYYRWHGSPQIYASNYDDAALDRLHMRIGRDLTRGARAWCIFDNTAAGAALGNALALADRHDAMLTMTCRSG